MLQHRCKDWEPRQKIVRRPWKHSVTLDILTIDVDAGGSLHQLSLGHGSVPDGAAVVGSVVLLAGDDGEDGLAGLGAGPAGQLEGGQRRVRLSNSVP